MTDGLDFTEWIEQTQARRDELVELCRSQIDTDSGVRHGDLDRSIQNADDAGRLRADAEAFLVQATAQAVLAYSKRRDEFTADERKALVRDSVRDVQRLVDGLTVTERTIKNRIYALMNLNRSR